MRKVAIVGCGGSGKSHVARELGRILDAPVTHLDAAFYDDEWNALPRDKFTDVQRELVSQPRWVIDANYNSTLLANRRQTLRWLRKVAAEQS
ncbi:hypothetical protein ACIA74_27520 [Streptomyces sp. NPDC051658]|uniref:hypothetical protein n=1 Tax=Streptomyces sp. NPDC051658 TaxID=3365667 RepID=UPI0037BBBC78